jgi:hypothetical protein
MKFFVNNIGMLSSVTRASAFWKTWKPEYLRSWEDVVENNDSRRCKDTIRTQKTEEKNTIDDNPEEFLKGTFGENYRIWTWKKLIEDDAPHKV